MSVKIDINDELWKGVSIIQEESAINKRQGVPDMFVGIALGFADKKHGKIYSKYEIYTIAQQLHREWLRRRVHFREASGNSCFKCV